MKEPQPVDTMPEFEPLVVRSSNLMLAANSHRAKGELFEAAVAWVEAGRVRAELGSKLLRKDHVHEAAQDILHAAACFLECGDHRPADEQLARFATVPQLAQVLGADEYLKSEHTRIKKWSADRRIALDKAREEASKQIRGDVTRHDRLRRTWVEKTLKDFPGVPEVHWITAQKYWGEDQPDCSIKHNWWCIRLRPKHPPYRIVLLSRLIEAREWREAVDTGDESVALLPEDPFILWFAGWARVQWVVEGRGSKSLLRDARVRLEKAVRLGKRISEPVAIGAACALAACLNRMGENQKANKLLSRLLRDYPTAVTDLAWMMLQTEGTKRDKVHAQNAGKITRRAWQDTGYEPSLMVGAA